MPNPKVRRSAQHIAPEPAASIRPVEGAATNAPQVVPADRGPATRPGPDPTSEMFEAKFHQLMDGFGATCEHEQIELAIAIALDPETKQPIIFTRGENYDLLQLMKWVYIRLRGQLMEDLSL